MKTAVSIPDELFRRVDALATDLRCSRSQLYADALNAYLKAREAASVTARLNAVYSTEPSQLDPVVAELQYRSLTRQPGEPA